MKTLTLIILFTNAILSCSSQQYVISTTVTGFPDSTKFFLKDLDTESNIDSALLIHDSFTMKGHLPQTPASLWLCANFNHNFYYLTLLIGNDTINVNGDIRDFPFNLSVTGSKIQDDLNILNVLTRDNYKKRDQLVRTYFTLQGDSAKIRGKVIVDSMNALDNTTQRLTKRFIQDHPNTYPALQYMFFLRKFYDRDSLRKLYARFTPSMRESQFGLRISSFLKVGDPVKKGDSMVDFAAFDKTGRIHHLSEYKGKYILLDFSTTYCGPCISSVTDMKKLSEAYRDKLTIVTLSGDGGKKTWLTGMERDRPTWLSLWDGKGTYGETMLKYGVIGFPTFCLIDPQGKILSIWTGYGKNDDGTGTLEAAVTKAIGK